MVAIATTRYFSEVEHIPVVIIASLLCRVDSPMFA